MEEEKLYQVDQREVEERKSPSAKVIHGPFLKRLNQNLPGHPLHSFGLAWLPGYPWDFP